LLAYADIGRIANPLNPAYKQSVAEFYINDLHSALILVPKGAHSQDSDAVRAGKRFNAAVAEVYWDGEEVVLDVKERGSLHDTAPQSVLSPIPEDVALVLHTSGTTGRPKAVPLSHRNLTTTMSMYPQSNWQLLTI
jgi:oxalate---CoA ligase